MDKVEAKILKVVLDVFANVNGAEEYIKDKPEEISSRGIILVGEVFYFLFYTYWRLVFLPKLYLTRFVKERNT